MRRFGQDASGASALEFALVATPLVLLLLGLIQLGIVFFANFMLEHATAEGARLIRTGQAQTQGLSASQFKNKICDEIISPLNCADLKVDVRSYSSFAGAASGLTQPLGSDGNLQSSFSFNPGLAGEVVVVRAFYPLSIGALLPSAVNLSNMSGDNRLLMATAAFRNEPYN